MAGRRHEPHYEEVLNITYIYVVKRYAQQYIGLNVLTPIRDSIDRQRAGTLFRVRMRITLLRITMPDNHSFSDGTSGDYKLVFEEHNGYFFACVEAGVLSDKKSLEYKQKIAGQISSRNFDRVMIKRDVPLTSSAIDLCAVIYLVKFWKVKQIKYAFVDVNPEHLNAYKLSILYARSRRIEVEAFGDVASAEKWLLSDHATLG